MTSAFSWLRPTSLAPRPDGAAPTTATVATARLPGPDVTRAVALIGVVVMNYHGYLNGGGAAAGRDASFAQALFDPWSGVLATRFAATFVLVAGVGVTLLTNRSRLGGDRAAISADRWRLVRRGVLLYGVGFLLNWIWSGTIIFFYGALFVVAAMIFTLRSRWIASARHGVRARRRGARVVACGARGGRRRQPTGCSVRTRSALGTARPALRHVRQRNASTVPVARVPVPRIVVGRLLPALGGCGSG
jgi:hypothetical protein